MYRTLAITVSLFILFISLGCSQEEPAAENKSATTQPEQNIDNKTAAALPGNLSAATLPTSVDPGKAKILERWKPDFDPSGAKYTYILSCIGHPDIEGVAVGFNIRDEVWKRSNGQIYVDYRPLAQLGGERDAQNKLRLGAIQGMLSSSVAAANIDSRLGIVNLPFLLDTHEKLEKFRNDPEMFGQFGATARAKGVLVADFTGYGSYGWASRAPVKTIEEARKVNFRIAQAPVNTELYRTWGMKFTVMPWPDVPQALQTGVIDGLDHTPIVCNISRKFDTVKNFTFLDYAQGLYIHLVNLKWLNTLPADLRKTFIEVINEESAKSRKATVAQEKQEIERAKANGVTFWTLAEGERKKLVAMSQPMYSRWTPRIGTSFINTVKTKLNAD